MKIVAISEPHERAANRSFLVEATAQEIAHLFGTPRVGDNWSSGGLQPENLRVGTEIRVDAAYQYVGWIYRHRESFERIAKQLREAADSIDKFPELFERLSIPPAGELKKQV